VNLFCPLTADVAVSVRRHQRLTECHLEVAVFEPVGSVRRSTGGCRGAEIPAALSLLASDSTNVHSWLTEKVLTKSLSVHSFYQKNKSALLVSRYR